MKEYKAGRSSILFILILLSVLLSTGCSSGGGDTGQIPGNSVTVTAVVPLNNTTGVAINTKVSATFSEAMDPLTITNRHLP